MVGAIQKLRQENPDKTIGVLSRNWRSTKRLYYKLQANGISHDFIEKDKGNAHIPGVKLTSFHSAKGHEFDYVIIMDLLDDINDKDLKDDEFMEVERRLLYVSITRAKTHLQIFYYDEHSVIFNEIDSQYYNKHVKK
ncbi:3'-5' exonuclease [Fredinandcohnia humi]